MTGPNDIDPDLVLRAADRLRELEASGVELAEVLAGEAGAAWIREDCGGDPRVARAAFALVHPKARFIDAAPPEEPSRGSGASS